MLENRKSNREATRKEKIVIFTVVSTVVLCTWAALLLLIF